jgi:hypothetical protein
MERSEQLNELAKALSLAQAEFTDAEKDRVNPHLKSKYATLGSVWDAAKGALTKHGLAVVQTPEPSEPGTLALTTMLLHTSGQFVAGTITMPLAKADPQGYGGAMTYARRYGLSAVLGICPADDDDAHHITEQQRQQQAPAPRPQPRPESRGDQRAAEALKAAEQPLTVAGGESAEAAVLRKQVRDLYMDLYPDTGVVAFWERLSTILGRAVKTNGELKADDWQTCIRGLEWEQSQRKGGLPMDAPESADFKSGIGH